MEECARIHLNNQFAVEIKMKAKQSKTKQKQTKRKTKTKTKQNKKTEQRTKQNKIKQENKNHRLKMIDRKIQRSFSESNQFSINMRSLGDNGVLKNCSLNSPTFAIVPKWALKGRNLKISKVETVPLTQV